MMFDMWHVIRSVIDGDRACLVLLTAMLNLHCLTLIALNFLYVLVVCNMGDMWHGTFLPQKNNNKAISLAILFDLSLCLAAWTYQLSATGQIFCLSLGCSRAWPAQELWSDATILPLVKRRDISPQAKAKFYSFAERQRSCQIDWG